MKRPQTSLLPWRHIKREPMGDFRVFRVERVVAEDGRGRPLGDFFTLVCRDWCNVVAVTSSDEIVMIWQYRVGDGTMSLEIPGGVVDDGESALDAAKRELLEETGYVAEEWSPLLITAANPALQNNRCHTFLAERATRVSAPTWDEAEELELELVPRSSLATLLDGGSVSHALVAGPLETYLRRTQSSASPLSLDRLRSGSR